MSGDAERRGRSRVVLAASAVGAVIAALVVAGSIMAIGTVRVSGPDVPSVTWHLRNMASNLVAAAFLGAVLVLLGSLLALVLRDERGRVALGLAGGAGLAVAGVAAHVVGQSVDAFDEVKTLLVRSGQAYTLRTTTEVGYWLMAVAGVLGVALFVLALLALRDAPAVGSRVAMLAASIVGALGSLAAAAGPLLPVHGASFLDQFYNDATPPFTSVMRAGVVVLVAVGGVTGFVVRRPWGLAMAFGAVSIAIWQTASTLLEFGDRPAALAGGNPDTIVVRVPQPHLVTAVGLVAAVVALLLGHTASLARRTAAAATR